MPGLGCSQALALLLYCICPGQPPAHLGGGPATAAPAWSKAPGRGMYTRVRVCVCK